jgi:hypothetical protein
VAFHRRSAEWQHHFPPTLDASGDGFHRFTGVDPQILGPN